MGMVKDIWMPPHDSLPQKWVAVTHPRDSQGISSQPKSWTLKRWDPPCASLLGLVGLSWTLDPLCFFVDNLTRAFFNVCWPFGMVPVSRTSKAFLDVLGNQTLTFMSFHVALVICMWSCCATSIIFVGTMAWEVLVRNIGKGTEKNGPFFSQLVDVVLGQATSQPQWWLQWLGFDQIPQLTKILQSYSFPVLISIFFSCWSFLRCSMLR